MLFVERTLQGLQHLSKVINIYYEYSISTITHFLLYIRNPHLLTCKPLMSLVYIGPLSLELRLRARPHIKQPISRLWVSLLVSPHVVLLKRVIPSLKHVLWLH